jgi:hypothetical protein
MPAWRASVPRPAVSGGVAGPPSGGEPVAGQVAREHGQRGAVVLVALQQPGDLGGGRAEWAGELAWGMAAPLLAGLPDLLVHGDGVRADGGGEVEGCGQHGLQDVISKGRGLVHGPAAGHLGDRGGGGPAPGPQARGRPVRGEQLAVAEQVDDDLGGGPANARPVLPGHGSVLVKHVAAVEEGCLAEMVTDLAEAGDALAGEPVQEPCRLAEAAAGGPDVRRCPVCPRQQRDCLMPRREHREDQLPGGQPPSRADDRREAEAAD